MTDPTGPLQATNDNEVSLLDLWQAMYAEWRLISACVVLGTLISVATALMMTPVYRAEVLTSPVSDGGGGLGKLSGQLGGLAALTGINVGGGESSTEVAIATLTSRAFISNFVKDEGLLPLLAPSSPEAKDGNRNEPGADQAPIMWHATQKFQNLINVSENRKTGLVTVSVEWTDREAAARWANLLVQRLNTHMKSLAIADANKNIAYLKAELANTQNVELRTAIGHLLENQVEKIMLAKGQKEYALRVIDPAITPPVEKHVRPRRKPIVIFGLIAGGLLGGGLALIRILMRLRRGQRDSTPA
ncbi:MAG: Wzz/FepE/Etk N-terminal domain-containing protein [Leptospirillia bacterium]